MSGPNELGKLRRKCDVCGAPVHHPKRGRPRRYCGDDCASDHYAAVKRAMWSELRAYRAEKAATAQGLVTP
jgi:hypothetical protein